jgi:hypothetical protein
MCTVVHLLNLDSSIINHDIVTANLLNNDHYNTILHKWQDLMDNSYYYMMHLILEHRI